MPVGELPVVQGLLEQWLFDAVRDHDLEAAKLRLRQGAAVDGFQAHAPVNGRTALHESAACGTAAIADQLFLAGADPDARDACGKTALHWACRSANADVGHALLGANADPNAATDDNAWTPLHYLAQHWTEAGCGDFAQALLDAGADPEALSAHQETPLTICARYDNHRVARVLLDHGAPGGGAGFTPGEGRLPPLAVAACSGASRVAALLVECGGRPFDRCQGVRAATTSSALGIARVHGHNRIARALRESPARLVKTSPARVRKNSRPGSVAEFGARARRRDIKTAGR